MFSTLWKKKIENKALVKLSVFAVLTVSFSVRWQCAAH